MTTADLAWDYTADEGSPLLSGGASELRISERKCILTHRQVLHLLNNLQEVSQILNDGNRRNSVVLPRQTQQAEETNLLAGGTLPSTLENIYRRYILHKLKVTYLFILLNLLLILSLLVDSLIDISSYPHVPYTSIVISCIASLGLVLIYFIQIWKFVNGEGLLVMHLMLSYVTTCFLFASLYTTSSCSQMKETRLHVLNFFNNFQVSLSVLTLSYYGQLQFHCWNSLVVISVQMVVSYCHFILMLLTLLKRMTLIQKRQNCDNPPQIIEDPLVINQVPFDDTASYTFNQNVGLYGSTDLLGRDFERTAAHSCPPSVCEVSVS